jgi:hypothetical protein
MYCFNICYSRRKLWKYCKRHYYSDNLNVNDKLSGSELDIKITPNPTVSDFTLTIGGYNKENVDIKVMDLAGKTFIEQAGQQITYIVSATNFLRAFTCFR